MDVTPIVQVLEAMPDGPTINLINIQGDVNLGDFNSPFARDFSKVGDLNAPFGRDFLDVTKIDDHSTNITGTGDIDKTQAAEVNKTNVQAPRIPSILEIAGIKQAPANGPVESTSVENQQVRNSGITNAE